MTINPNEHLIQLKSKQGDQDYLPVQWRLAWFRDLCPEGTIDTDEVCVDLDREVTVEAFVWNNEKRRSEKVLKTAKGYARYKATVTDGKGGRATGHGSECAADFPDFAEKAETKSIGRALAALGYGTQFAPDFNEGHRIVDSLVERSQGNATLAHNETVNQAFSTNATPQSADLSTIPTVKQLHEMAAELHLEWDAVLLNAFDKPIKEGKATLDALKKKGDELPPGYCQRLAAYLQSLQAA